MVGHGGSSASSYLADPTSPIPSHCASIVVTSTVRVNLGQQRTTPHISCKCDGPLLYWRLKCASILGLKTHPSGQSQPFHHIGQYKKLSVESKWFERGVNEAVYIQTLYPSLNRDRVRHNLPPIWNNIIKERLTEISERFLSISNTI